MIHFNGAIDGSKTAMTVSDTLIELVLQAYKQGAIFKLDGTQLSIAGDIDQSLLTQLNSYVQKSQARIIETLQRVEYWRQRFVSGKFYSLEDSERVEANYYAKKMGFKLNWVSVDLTDVAIL